MNVEPSPDICFYNSWSCFIDRGKLLYIVYCTFKRIQKRKVINNLLLPIIETQDMI